MIRHSRSGDAIPDPSPVKTSDFESTEPHIDFSKKLAVQGLSGALDRWQQLTNRYRAARWASYAAVGAAVLVGVYEVGGQLVHMAQALVDHSINNLTDIVPLTGSDNSQIYPDFSGHAPIPTDAPAHPLSPDMVP